MAGFVAQHGRIGRTQGQRRDADAQEQVAQLRGQRADHPLEALLRQVRPQQQDQAPPLAGARGRQMADLGDGLARGRGSGRREQRFDRRTR